MSERNVITYQSQVRTLGHGAHNRHLAHDLVELGFKVFPCKESGPPGVVKSPYTSHGFKDASDDPAQIATWWDEWPDAVPGLPTGKENGLIILDLDHKDGKDGFAAMDLLRLHVPDSPFEVRTPSGGRHVYFRWRKGVTGTQGRIAGRKAPGVDIRGAGGYCIAPGARMADGTRYRLLGESDWDDLRFADDLPRWPDEFIAPEREDHEEDGRDRDWPQLTLDEADSLIAELRTIEPDHTGEDRPWVEDREGNIRIGMALHHEFQGSRSAFEIWLDHALQSRRAKAKRHYEKQWRAFDSDREDAVTIASLIAEAPEWRHARSLAGIADEFAENDFTHPTHHPMSDEDSSLLTPDDCMSRMLETPDYLVKGLFERESVCVIYGQPNAGKSVVAPYLGYMVAKGADRVFGRRVRQAPVLYVAYEGPRGMQRRIATLRDKFGPAPKFYLQLRPPSLLPANGKSSPGEKLILKRIKQTGAGLVIIDTLAAAFGGMEENSMSKDGMGLAIRVAQTIAAQNCAVVLIHHPTKTGETMRGSGGLNGALDVVVRVEKDGDIVTAVGEKMRDDETGRRFQYRNAVAVLGADDDGDDITSVWCEEIDELDFEEPVEVSLPRNTRRTFEILKELAEGGKATLKAWRNACTDADDDRKPDSIRKAFDRDVGKLIDAKMVCIKGVSAVIVEGEAAE